MSMELPKIGIVSPDTNPRRSVSCPRTPIRFVARGKCTHLDSDLGSDWWPDARFNCSTNFVIDLNR